MLRHAVAAVALGWLIPVPHAAAEPVAPQPDSPCHASLIGALTKTAVQTLECSAQGWQPVSTATPSSDRWVSFGPVVTLHGNGLRNPELESGDWVGTPLTATDRCTVQQVAVLRGVGAGPPEDFTGEPGRPLSFSTPELVFSIEFGGGCLWRHR